MEPYPLGILLPSDKSGSRAIKRLENGRAREGLVTGERTLPHTILVPLCSPFYWLAMLYGQQQRAAE